VEGRRGDTDVICKHVAGAAPSPVAVLLQCSSGVEFSVLEKVLLS